MIAKHNNFICKHAFTLIELVLSILLTAIISTSILPRLFNYNVFKQNLFTKTVYSSLYYAQNLAIGSGCHIAVNITSTTLFLNLRNNCTNGNFTIIVQDPTNINKAYLKQAPKGMLILYSGVPFYFDQNGQARSIYYNDNVADGTITVSGANIKSIINIKGSQGIIQ